MRVLMMLAREWQDGGRSQRLDVGQTYDLPDVVAQELLVFGAAVIPDDDRGLVPPESKPVSPPETKTRGRTTT